jgi:hypothetical protein
MGCRFFGKSCKQFTGPGKQLEEENELELFMFVSSYSFEKIFKSISEFHLFKIKK